MVIGTPAIEWTEKAQKSPFIGGASNDIWIEAPRITDRPKIGSLAYQGTNYNYLIEKYDWDNSIAYAVLLAESGGNPNAVNEKDYHKRANCWGSFGLFQIGCLHGLENWQDPEANIQKAYEIYKRDGWNAWGAYTDKSYLKYL